MREPSLAIVATPREWGQRLLRHVADHGGASVRATVVTPADAVAESYDVLLLDDSTSFLSSHLVDDLRGLGRYVLGLCDPTDERGRAELLDCGISTVLPSDAPSEQIVEYATRLAARPAAPSPPAAARPPGTEGCPVIFVGGPTGGAGVSEVALALAWTLAEGGARTVLVDADEAAPALATRIGLAPYPHVRSAAEAVRTGRSPAGAVQPGPSGLVVLAGAAATDLPPLARADGAALLAALAATHDRVVVDIGAATTPAGLARQTDGVTLAATVAVGLPTPTGVSRLGAWLDALPARGAHVVLNRAPASAFRRSEAARALCQGVQPASVCFLPDDRRVDEAAWRGEPVRTGRFAKRVRELTALLAVSGGWQA